MKRIINWVKSLHIKLTWKSLLALALLASSYISQAQGSNIIPARYAQLISIAAIGLLAFERIAEAIDNQAATAAQTTFMSISGASVGAALTDMGDVPTDDHTVEAEVARLSIAQAQLAYAEAKLTKAQHAA